MRKFICIITAALLLLSLCACGHNDSDHESVPYPTDSTKPDAVSDDSTGAVETKTTDVNDIIEYEAPSGEKVTKKLYAVLDENEIKTNDFSFIGGSVTPERIAAGLAGWTGLSFRITAETDKAAKRITVNFLPDSTFVKGEIPDKLTTGFAFDDIKTVQIFMMNSICKTIRENMGGYDVFFTANGEDIATLDIAKGLNSETAFNKTQSDAVKVK